MNREMKKMTRSKKDTYSISKKAQETLKKLANCVRKRVADRADIEPNLRFEYLNCLRCIEFLSFLSEYEHPNK